MTSVVVSRAIVGATLVAGGIASLPLAAMVLDRGVGTENWILPAQLLGMTAVGAGLGAMLPAFAGATASHGKAAMIGAAAGLGAAILGDIALFTLIAG